MNLKDYQRECALWTMTVMDEHEVQNIENRRNRFIEEAIELAQATGATKADILNLVDYVYDRPVGDAAQEVGGVTLTLGALCNAIGVSWQYATETLMDRCWQRDVRDKVRQKWLTRPVNSPRPGVPL